MNNTNQEPAAPDLEYFFGVLYKVYCGSCERLMYIAGKGFTKAKIMDDCKACKWCGRSVKWE